MSKLQAPSHIALPSKAERHKRFGSVDPGPKSKPTIKEKMVDLQNTEQDFLFEIDQVGVSNVKYPVVVTSTTKPYTQTTIGTFTLTANLGKMSKGTNMSRFLEEVEQADEGGFLVDFTSLTTFAKDLKARLHQEIVTIEVAFPWFFARRGPSSGKSGLNHADITLKVVYKNENEVNYSASMTALITTLCPCSKEISEYSAHSQRGRVTMEVDFTGDYNEKTVDWKEALLLAAETNASAIIYPVLKRPDEKYVTETAYENPRFVEDIVRLVAADLYEMPFVQGFSVTCENEESIHMHNAIATIQFTKDQ